MPDSAPTYHERCPCGAEIDLFPYEPQRQQIRDWRDNHRHEMPATTGPTVDAAEIERIEQLIEEAHNFDGDHRVKFVRMATAAAAAYDELRRVAGETD